MSGSQSPDAPGGRRSGFGLTQGALWFHARRGGLTAPDLTPELAKAYLLSLPTLPAVFLASIPVAFLSAIAAQVMWGVIAVFGNLIRRRIQSALSRSRPSPA